MTDDLATLDQNDAYLRLAAVAENVEALVYFADAGAATATRYADRAAAAAKFMSDDVRDIVTSDMTHLKRELAEMNATVREFGALLSGAMTLARGLRDQRDATLHELAQRPDANTLYDQLCERLAAANGCALADAQRALYILVSDVVIGADVLQQFRDEVMGALLELDTRVLP